MKKYYLIGVCVLVLLITGCGKKAQVVCTGSYQNIDLKVDAELTADIDSNGKVTNVDVVYDLFDEETAKSYCDTFNAMDESEKPDSVSCSGTKIYIKGMKILSAEDGSIVGKTKEELLAAAKKEQFVCK